VLINVVYYAITAALLPALCLTLERMLGIDRFPTPWLRIAGGVLIGIGAALQIWCLGLLQQIGRGTPSPAVPTSRLVTAGPYRFIRNPLNLGEVLVFLGLAAWFGSLWLLSYAILAWLAFQIFIIRVEEPRHRREFGDEYANYVRAVPRRWMW
jgi:protein-S-isoprenylcysteine O-methyltransferase Ste14